MKVKCLHGYFIFEELRAGQVSEFISYLGISLVPKDNYYTFDFIKNIPDYSIEGVSFLNLSASKTFEGKPWEIFEANNFIYDFNLNQLRLISTVTLQTKVLIAGNRFISQGLIMPGSTTQNGRVKNYSAWYSRDTQRWLYTEVDFV